MIAYFAYGKLKKIDAKGGPSFPICEAGNGRGGTWNKDGVIVFAPASGGPLHQVVSAGGTSKQLTSVDTTEFEVNNRWPYFLPDGNHFLYSAQTNKSTLDEESENIHIGSLQNGNGKIILHATSNTAYNNGWLLYYKQKSLLAQRFDDGSLELRGEPIPIIENLLQEPARSKAAFSLSRNDRLVLLGTSKTNQEAVIFNPQGVGTFRRARTANDPQNAIPR